MANSAFVGGLLAQMIEEARIILFGLDDPRVNPQQHLPRVANKWASILGARNPNFLQKLTPQAQGAWLRAHGYGSGDRDPCAPVLALITETLGRYAEACTAHAEGRIGHQQADFWIDAAIEDCSCMLRGFENPAD